MADAGALLVCAARYRRRHRSHFWQTAEFLSLYLAGMAAFCRLAAFACRDLLHRCRFVPAGYGRSARDWWTAQFVDPVALAGALRHRWIPVAGTCIAGVYQPLRTAV